MQLVLPSAIHGHRRLLNHAATTTEINYKHRVVDRRQPRFQPTSIIRHKDRFIRANRTSKSNLLRRTRYTRVHGMKTRRGVKRYANISWTKFSCNHVSPSLMWNRFNGQLTFYKQIMNSCIWIPLVSIVDIRWKHLGYYLIMHFN